MGQERALRLEKMRDRLLVRRTALSPGQMIYPAEAGKRRSAVERGWFEVFATPGNGCFYRKLSFKLRGGERFWWWAKTASARVDAVEADHGIVDAA